VLFINIKSDIITSDNLGNIYAITGNTIRKYNRSGNFIGEFTMKRFDKFDDADPSDPFKILIFNKTSGEIIRLDNKLSLIGDPVSLFSLEIISPVSVCNSWDNGIWVYDISLNEIIRINTQATIEQRSGPLDNIVPAGSHPSMIRELDFLVYVSLPAHGIFVFDRYANLIKRIPLNNINTFQLSTGKIMFVKNNELVTFNTSSLSQNSIPLPVKSAINASLQGNTLFIQRTDTISIHTIITNQ
jgi:hypothetical protein